MEWVDGNPGSKLDYEVSELSLISAGAGREIILGRFAGDGDSIRTRVARSSMPPPNTTVSNDFLEVDQQARARAAPAIAAW